MVEGRVAIEKLGGSASELARVGDAVTVADLVRTGQDARAQAVLSDDSVVNLAPGTSLRILQYAHDAAVGRRTAVVKVAEGKARFVVSRRDEGRFNIETGEAAVAIGAGDVVVAAGAGETTIAVLEGSAGVRNTSPLVVGTINVARNQTATVGAKTPPSQPVAITPQQRKAYARDARHF